MREGVVDTVQVIYDVVDQSPVDELLPACAERGAGVIARVPLDEGALTGRIGPGTTFPDDDVRNVYLAGARRREVAERAQAIADGLGVGPDDLPEIALRHGRRGLPAEQVRRLKAHRRVRGFYPG